MQLWSSSGTAYLHPCRGQSWGNSTGSTGGPACREMEPSQTHSDLPHRRLRNHWVSGRRTSQQGHGALNTQISYHHQQHKILRLHDYDPSLFCSISECLMTLNQTTCFIWWWRTGSWSSPHCSSLSMEVCRTSTCLQNWSRFLGKDWSKQLWPPEPGSSPEESILVQLTNQALSMMKVLVALFWDQDFLSLFFRSDPPCWRCSQRSFIKVQRKSLCYWHCTLGHYWEQRGPHWERCKTTQTKPEETTTILSWPGQNKQLLWVLACKPDRFRTLLWS